MHLIIFRIKDLDSTTKASHLLLKQLLNKLPISKEQYVTDSVKVVVTIVFYSVIQLSSCVKEHAELTVNDSTKKVQEVLVKFLDRNYGSTAGFVFDSPKEMMVRLHVVATLIKDPPPRPTLTDPR